ncbi:hypothetical protein [Sphingomonas rhizophila]|uniref:hypothetical protein n=1 Tax=Sphingomonas rhizophila TaxID=2071607 RepID=UPI003CCD0FF2
MRGRSRCRIHGGAKGSGGPRGDENGAYRHGNETKKAVSLRRLANRLLRDLQRN